MRYPLTCVLFLSMITSFAQYSLTGTKGLINVPEAAVLEDRTFQIGMHTNAEEYLLIDYGGNRRSGDEYVSSVSIGFLNRINVTLMLSRIFGDNGQSVGQRSSIGDRSLQITTLVLKESTWRPAIIVNVTDPFFSSNQYLAGNHIVATKRLYDDKSHVMKLSMGYGVPYVFAFVGQERRELREKESDFLTGLFGGFQYVHKPTSIAFSMEYDGQTVNTGIGATLWESLSIQAYLQEFSYPGIGINYRGLIR